MCGPGKRGSKSRVGICIHSGGVRGRAPLGLPSNVSWGGSDFPLCEPWICSVTCFLLGKCQYLQMRGQLQDRALSLHCPAFRHTHISPQLVALKMLVYMTKHGDFLFFTLNSILFSLPLHTFLYEGEMSLA